MQSEHVRATRTTQGRQATFKRTTSHGDKGEGGSLRPRRRLGRILSLVVLVAGGSLALAACGGSSQASSKSSGQTIVLWHNGSFAATTTKLLTNAFSKLHPGVKFDLVAQPSGDYFAALQAALISGKGPDIVNLWPAQYMTRFESHLVNLDPYIPTSLLKKVSGESYFAKNGSLSSGTYAVPFENQFYNGFYDKSLFAKAHIAAPPRTWSELTSDCAKLKSAGAIPIVYGAQSGSGEFNPVYEWSYLLAGVYPLKSWNGLLDGHISYSSSAIVSQLSRWHSLDTAGCINSNALTNKVAANEFTSGKAAMIFKGSWDAGSFYQSMGSKVGVMLPPYSTSPMSGIVEETGEGYGIPVTATHKAMAIKFLKFILSPQGQEVIAKSGQAPVLPGYKATNPLQESLLSMANSSSYHVYPMFDNLMQAPVESVAARLLDQVLVGQVSPSQAASEIASAESNLPSSARAVDYHLGG